MAPKAFYKSGIGGVLMDPKVFYKSEKVFGIKSKLFAVNFSLQQSVIHLLNSVIQMHNLCYQFLGSLCKNLLAPRSTRSQVFSARREFRSERGDVPGWVLVVLMTAGLVTGIWTLAAPRLNLILRNSLDSMNAIR